MGRKVDQFLLLLWKNWKLQYRRPLQTTVEILAPILFTILLVILRSLVDPVAYPEAHFEPFHPLPPYIFSKENGTNFTNMLENYTIIYSPSPNKQIDRCMETLKMAFQNIEGYKNSKQVEKQYTALGSEKILAAIEFDDDLYGKDYIPSDVAVSLRFPAELRTFNEKIFFSKHPKDRKDSKDETVVDKLNKLFQVREWKTHLMRPIFESPGPRDPRSNNGAVPSYYAEGFLALQAVLTFALIYVQMDMVTIWRFMKKELTPPVIQMQRFPHAHWKADPLLPAMISFIGILVMLSFVYTCINTVKVITNEKEKQLKEAMKIMGLPNWLHWTAWFTKTISFLLISVITIVLLMTIRWYPHKQYSIFTHTNPLILFLFLMFYMFATITFCFSISVFFSKANTAATVAGLLWFLSYAPYLFLQTQYDQLSLSLKLVVCLGSNTAMAYGFQMFLMYEGSSEGIQWHNIWLPNTVDDNLSLGLVLVMLTVDALIYLCITLYVEAVFPGEFGTPQPWYFPVTKRYWCGNVTKVTVPEALDMSPNQQDFHRIPAIKIINLGKVFGKKVAVKELSMVINNDQITVLLGHNGAGKTSVMSMLTGIIPASSGTALVKGFDIRTNMKEIRANLGLCPQHNLLFDDLTVREHLYFFSRLKGINKLEITDEIEKYLILLDLVIKSDKRSSTLSGGMKRKLCVGIALCGGSKVVLLDEPTAGMDPSSRRGLWDLIQFEKKGRCILLTTHYMDEADLLGDRIAIMANGELKCFGSSFELKKRFGLGYHLILDKYKNCEYERITELLQKYIPDIQIHRNLNSELVYILEERYVKVFEEMLNELEQSAQRFGIRSYGISLTTLEDVFIKVGADTESVNVTDPDFRKGKSKTKLDFLVPPKLPNKKIHLLTGVDLIRNQFFAMFMKKMIYALRTWILQLIQILIPVAFLIIAIVVSRNIGKNRIDDLPKLELVLDRYEDTVTLIQDEVNNNMSNFYKEILKKYQTEHVENISKRLLELTDSVPTTVRRRYLIGGSFIFKNGMNDVTAWFNNDPYHTPPLALALVLNSIYKSILGKDHSITFFNHPLPFSPNTKVEKLLKGSSIGPQLAFNVGFSMAFVSSFYILFNVKERVSKSKHLQFASGIKSYIFWTASYICDLLTFIITVVVILITLVCFQEEGFQKADEIGRMFLMLFYFGFAMIPMMYVASDFFDIPSTGYTRMTLFSVFTGVAAFLVVQILGSPGLFLKHIGDALHWGFLLSPHYSLAAGIRDSYITYATKKFCNFFVDSCLDRMKNLTLEDCWNMACHNNSELLSQYCCDRNHDYFKWTSPGIGRNLVYSFLTGVVLFLLLNVTEYRFFSKVFDVLFKKNEIKTYEIIPNEEEDVAEEKRRIRSLPPRQLLKEHSLVLKDVTKYYNDFLAVNGICLGIKQFECFGLLGVNGAGKTTTFKIITGDLQMTFGNAWVEGFGVKMDLEKVQRVIGYCPQFDALLLDLTAKETLMVFALLRGIPLKDCTYISEKLSQDFDFYQHLHKKVKQLSGGNKRKLSTAISLLGDPPVICLDEPSAGMDPVTKRNLWDALCTVRDSGKCILLTSHSMEECEALCTKLAIMVNGNFQCLGSVQHLKNKYADGYTLTIKTKRSHLEESHDVERFIMETFPTAKQQDRHQELISYHIVEKNICWSKLFGILEKEKNRLNIEDYSLGQATLEQIFLNLTQTQR